MQKPNRTDIPAYFAPFFDLAKGTDIYQMLKVDIEDAVKFFQAISEEKSEYRYEEGKWTPKEIICHLTSAEVYFCSLMIKLTNDQNSGPTAYALGKYDMGAHVNKPYHEVLNHLVKARTATIQLLQSYDEELLNKLQIFKGNNYTPLALSYLIIGHTLHHCNIIKERYL